MRTLKLTCVGLAMAVIVGCGKKETQNDTTTKTMPPESASAATEATPPPPASAVVAPKAVQHVELEIASVANTMTFDKTALTVPTGAEVHLVFKNNATMTTLPHNWVLVKTGTEASVAAAGLKLGEKAGYIDVGDHDLLVHTPLAKPGETSDLTFTAPEPGKYPYICTVPGHYMLMKGVLTVTP